MTPVTVIEAGPCPVVQVKTTETDGYDAVQLAFDEVAERKLSKAELGHLKKTASAPHRRLVEFRGPSELDGRRDRHRRGLRARRPVKVSGISIGKGFAGTIKRHNFSRGPEDARLAQHPQAGLDRRLGDALARVQGHEDGRPDGRQARDAGRPRRPRGRPRAEPAARQGRGARAEERHRRGQGGEGGWPPPQGTRPPCSTPPARRRRRSRSTRPSSAPTSSRTSSTRPCARS